MTPPSSLYSLEVTPLAESKIDFSNRKEERLMPPAVPLTQLMAMIVPTANWPWPIVLLQGVFTIILAELMSTNVALKWLFIGVCLDVFLFLVRSWRMPDTHPWSLIIPDVLVRFVAIWLSWSLSKEAAFQFSYMGLSTNPGEVLAVFFITIVWASAGKSSEKLGMPWPSGVMFLLNKVHSSLDDADLGDRAFSVLTKFTQKTDHGTTTTEKKTTAVSTPAEKVD